MYTIKITTMMGEVKFTEAAGSDTIRNVLNRNGYSSYDALSISNENVTNSTVSSLTDDEDVVIKITAFIPNLKTESAQ